MARIFAYIVHKAGVVDDSAAELAVAAKRIDAAAPVTALVTGFGMDLDAACNSLCASFEEVWKISSEALAYPDAGLVRKALVDILPPGSIVLAPHNTFGMDMSPGLSIKTDSAFVPDVVDIEGCEETRLKLVRQEYGGQVSAHIGCDISSGVVLNIRSGAFKVEECSVANGVVVDHSIDMGDLTGIHRRYIETVEAEMGDVDITKEEVLVSVGRGIQEQENIAIAQELADAMTAAVSCSRPIIDAKWMEKSRQVGTSGQTVKPKVYIACGISGSFQHMGGLKGNPFIVAINKNPKAPIFQAANVGIVADILEFLPALTNRIRRL
jgi:electron transfer flavoprotein alpha subunit